MTSASRIATLCILAACAGAESWTWDLPHGFEPPFVPDDNPISEAKVELGESLFHDPRLSVNGTTSCATCHQPDRAFTDGRARAIGATGEPHERNTPTLINVAYNVSFGWIDGGLDTLEAQHRVPLMNRAPVEMGFGADQLAALRADPEVSRLTQAGFGRSAIEIEDITRAIASYVRTLIFADTPFDRYLFEDHPLSAPALRGMELFFAARFGCSQCHAGITFSGPSYSVPTEFAGATRNIAPAPAPRFHDHPSADIATRAPTLRELRRTAPYLHDGSAPTLGEVVARYRIDASNAEIDDLIAFLLSLSRETLPPRGHD